MIFLKPKFWDKTKISFFSILLFPITLILKLLSFIKKIFTKSNILPIPVICVGNIYLGGTGKTPISVEIFSILKNLDKNPVFIRKKYDSFRDEVNLQKQTGPIYQNKKRIDAIKKAVQDGADVAILDDGFQDFSVNKNLSIICFNENQWIGNGLTIPSGPLREELSALKRADCVVINGKKNTNIENKIYRKKSNIKIFYAKYKSKNIEEFKNKKIIAFAGIGNPINFFNLLKESGLNIIENISFPDHYAFMKKDLKNLLEKAKKNNATLLTTEKNYYRIKDDNKKEIAFIKLKIEIENLDKFLGEIKKII